MGARDHSHLLKAGGEAQEALLEKRSSESESETEIESIDSPIGHTIERPRRRGNVPVVLGFALFNIVALITLYFVLSRRLAAASFLSPPGDRILPPREFETRVFKPQHLKPGAESDAQWEADGPSGDGWITIQDPDSLHLPWGLRSGGGKHRRYGLTWAHQYHCLMMLRKEFWLFVGNNSTLIGKDLSDADPDAAYMWHLAHCFDYLKQSTLCSMDMTIEYPTRGGPLAVNGYDIPHTCTKRSVYDRFMEEHLPDIELPLPLSLIEEEAARLDNDEENT